MKIYVDKEIGDVYSGTHTAIVLRLRRIIMLNFTVTVDGHALWYLLRRLETYLENECPSGVELDKFKSRGLEAQEFRIIKEMQDQITKEYK